MADDILRKEGAQTPRLDTFSYYDKTEPNGDDWTYFQKIEESRGRVGAHIETSCLVHSASLECCDFAALPGSLGTGTKITAERAKVVRDGGYRAVLSGIGGDEFLGGVPNHTAHLADLIMQVRLLTLSKQLMAWSLAKRQPLTQLLWQASLNLFPASVRQHFGRAARVEPWIDKSFAKRTRLAIRLLDAEEHFGLRLPTRRSYIGGVLMMANKMAKQLAPPFNHEEARYPYLDPSLIEFILSIPADQLLRPGDRRSLMRRALVGIVPHEILARQTKQLSARTPLIALKANWLDLQTLFKEPVSGKRRFIDRERFAAALEDTINGKPIHLARLLKTISLEFWLQALDSRRLLDPALFSSQPAIPEGRLSGPLIATERFR